MRGPGSTMTKSPCVRAVRSVKTMFCRALPAVLRIVVKGAHHDRARSGPRATGKSLGLFGNRISAMLDHLSVREDLVMEGLVAEVVAALLHEGVEYPELEPLRDDH